MKINQFVTHLFTHHYLAVLFALSVININSAQAACPYGIHLDPSAFATPIDHQTFKHAVKEFSDHNGCYSKTYQSSWLTLPTGKDIMLGKNLGVISRTNHFYPGNSSPHHYNTSTTSTAEVLLSHDFLHLHGIRENIGSIDPDTGNLHNDFFEFIDDFSSKNASFIKIRDVKYILIEDLAIEHKNPAPTLTHTIDIVGCDTVVIRNSYFKGPAWNYHIEIKGCKNVFIENVEVEGTWVQVDGDDYRFGGAGAINIDNGDNKDFTDATLAGGTTIVEDHASNFTCSINADPATTLEDHIVEKQMDLNAWPANCIAYTSTKPYWIATEWKNNDYSAIATTDQHRNELEDLVIQSVYVHDIDYDWYETVGNRRSVDAIALSSPADGIVFNSVIENWGNHDESGLDASVDADHRRYCDYDYSNRNFRLERNMFLDANFIKTPGLSDSSNTLDYISNILKNTYLIDYHKKHAISFIHNTIVFDSYLTTTRNSVFYKLVDFFWDSEFKAAFNHFKFTDNFINEVHTAGQFRIWRANVSSSAAALYEYNNPALTHYLASPTLLQGDLLRQLTGDDNYYTFSLGYYDSHATGTAVSWFYENTYLDSYDAGNSCAYTQSHNLDTYTSFSDFTAHSNEANSTYNSMVDGCITATSLLTTPGDFDFIPLLPCTSAQSGTLGDFLYDDYNMVQDFGGAMFPYVMGTHSVKQGAFGVF